MCWSASVSSHVSSVFCIRIDLTQLQLWCETVGPGNEQCVLHLCGNVWPLLQVGGAEWLTGVRWDQGGSELFVTTCICHCRIMMMFASSKCEACKVCVCVCGCSDKFPLVCSANVPWGQNFSTEKPEGNSCEGRWHQVRRIGQIQVTLTVSLLYNLTRCENCTFQPDLKKI